MCNKGATRPPASRASRVAQSGLGLVDTLVALLLLALSLLGACTLLARTLGASRAATLQTTAVDLATDLGEDLRSRSGSFPDPEAIQAWRGRVAAALPVGSPPLDQYATAAPTAGTTVGQVRSLDMSLRWWDPAIHSPTRLSLAVVDPRTAPVP